MRAATSVIGTKRTCQGRLSMSAPEGKTDVPREPGHFRFCGGFRLPGCRSIHALRRPAAEKRQGTKSREVGHRWGSGHYGDYMSAPSSGVDALLLEYGWRIRTLVRS
jgi:hypothetical protein